MSIPQEARTVEAEKFVLRDGKGRVRAEMGTTGQDGPPYLHFFDSSQRPRLTLELLNYDFQSEPREVHSAALSLLDESGNERASVRMMGADSEIRLSDRTGKAWASLMMMDHETEPWPEMTLWDRDGLRVMLVVAHDGLPHLTLYDKSNKARLHLTLDRRGRPYVEKYRSGWLAKKFWSWKWYGYYPRKNADLGFDAAFPDWRTRTSKR